MKGSIFCSNPSTGKKKKERNKQTRLFLFLDSKLYLKPEDRSYDCPLVAGCSKELIFRQKKLNLTQLIYPC